MITIGSILRFSKQKNIIMTVNVAIRVCQTRSNVSFILVGDGEYYDLCRQMVKTHNLESRIELPGWQENTAEWLAKFDIFLLYSLYEGLPLSIIEAMYAALPVIASAIPANAELVDTSTGWLIPSEQPDRLEAELLKILDAKNSYGQKGEFGKVKAMELCSYEKFIKGYLLLYNGK
jgi:glycosyltransferase involved in cell wall biosynthesis